MRNSLLDPVVVVDSLLDAIPDDILICILTRLHVRDIVQCRFVCKRWNDLTSNPHFEEMLLLMPLVSPMILVKHDLYPYKEFCIDKWWIKNSNSSLHEVTYPYKEFRKDKWWINNKDKWWINNSNSSLIHHHEVRRKLNTPFYTFQNIHHHQVCRKLNTPFYTSQNGFIIAKKMNQYTILNPMTSHEVNIFVGEEELPSCVSLDIIGIYLHPIRKVYCILWRLQMLPDEHKQYKMLNLGSNTKPTLPLWTNIGHTRKHRWHDYSLAVYCLNDCFIYWLINGGKWILAFDIKTEAFTRGLPLPLLSSSNHYRPFPPRLVSNGDGCLALVHFVLDNTAIAIKIFTLKDGRFWTPSQNVRYENLWGIKYDMCDRGPRALAIANGQLVFWAKVPHSYSRQVFVCNLHQSETLRNIGSHPEYSKFLVHCPTIVSLRNCPPIIHILPPEILQEDGGASDRLVIRHPSQTGVQLALVN